MHFRIQGLDLAPFRDLFGLSDEALAARCARRERVDAKPGYPDRVTLTDAEPGQSVLLVNYVHQDNATPYHASHAIFVRESEAQRYDRVDEIPESLRTRVLSVRAFDADHLMVDADLSEGRVAETLIGQYFERRDVAYLDIHYAKRGCFACRVTRV
jgi:hypothetical protein